MKQLMHQWDDDFNGWPIHDFQWAYLESLVAPTQPVSEPMADMTSPNATQRRLRRGVAAEPAFSPKPGLLAGDTNIVLQCDTPGAVIHFTVNPSQPPPTPPCIARRSWSRVQEWISRHLPARRAKKTARS